MKNIHCTCLINILFFVNHILTKNNFLYVVFKKIKNSLCVLKIWKNKKYLFIGEDSFRLYGTRSQSKQFY